MNYNKPLIIDLDIAVNRAAKFCAYQERCQFDLEKKLIEWNVDSEIRDEVMVHMIQENFINEERFTHAFVQGKINIKRWGWIKIRNELKARKISDYSIKKAFNGIDKEKYLLNLHHLIQQKTPLIIAKNDYERKMKLIQYLWSRGYELELINQELE